MFCISTFLKTKDCEKGGGCILNLGKYDNQSKQGTVKFVGLTLILIETKYKSITYDNTTMWQHLTALESMYITASTTARK